MSGSKAVVGVFEFMDDALQAVNAAKEDNRLFEMYSPAPNHHALHEIYKARSSVRMLTLTGALTGLTAGFALAIWTSLDYPLRVSAKDIVSVPGFVVVGYECTILFGALATLLAIGLFCRVPNPFRKPGYDPRFSYDRFGVVINCDENEIDHIRSKLEEMGAEEVNVTDGI